MSVAFDIARPQPLNSVAGRLSFLKPMAEKPVSRRRTSWRPESSDGYVRLSVGIEQIDDSLADLDQALNAAGSLAEAA